MREATIKDVGVGELPDYSGRGVKILVDTGEDGDMIIAFRLHPYSTVKKLIKALQSVDHYRVAESIDE